MRLGASFLAAHLAACGGAHGPAARDAGTGDAGTDAGPSIEIAAPAAPAPPELPRMTPCPAGWREVTDPDDAELVVCDPWPETGPEDCVGASAHFAGGAGCERIGSDCPAGDYAADLPVGGTIVYVRAGASPGGDGSLASPYATIAEGVLAAPDGATVALSKGTFVEAIAIARGVTLHGACADETTIECPSDATTDATLVLSGGARVENLRVTGDRVGIHVDSPFVEPDPVEIDSVLVENAVTAGLLLTGMATATATDVITRDTQPSGGVDLGYGIDVGGNAELDLERAVVERSHDVGVIVWGPGRLVARDLVVKDSLPASIGAGGIGILTLVAGNLDLTRTVADSNRGAGIRVADQSFLVGRSLAILDTREDELGFGVGLDVVGISYATVDQVLIDRSRIAGVSATLSAHVVATDLVVRDGTSSDPFASGNGLLVQDAEVTLERTYLVRSRFAGIQAAAAEIDATDLAIAGTTQAFGGGWGILANFASTIDLERAKVTGGGHAGIEIDMPGTILTAVDLEVDDVESDDILIAVGYGLSVIDGAAATLERAVFRRNRSVGIILEGNGTTMSATDVVVRDTRSEERRLDFGYGLALMPSAFAELERARFEGNRRAGVVAFGEGSVAELREVEVLGTLERDCATGTCVEDGCRPCPGAGGGSGIAAIDGAQVTVTRFRSADGALCGVQVGRGGGLDLHEGEVSQNPFGANVQDADYEVDRLRDDVRYFDNEVLLDTSALPLPDPVGL